MYVERRLFVRVDAEKEDGANIYNAHGCALALAVYLDAGAPYCYVHGVEGCKVDYSARTWVADSADSAARNVALQEATNATACAVRAFLHGWRACTYAQEIEQG